MSKEPIEMSPQTDFDHDAHIAAFLQVSAVYLGVSADPVMALSNSAWQPVPATFVLEAQHA
jgi:hypothetical protein